MSIQTHLKRPSGHTVLSLKHVQNIIDWSAEIGKKDYWKLNFRSRFDSTVFSRYLRNLKIKILSNRKKSFFCPFVPKYKINFSLTKAMIHRMITDWAEFLFFSCLFPKTKLGKLALWNLIFFQIDTEETTGIFAQ